MFNNLKSQEFFDPHEAVKENIHIIGCGAVGGPVAELLVRLGCSKLHIWDPDEVSAHNLGNQIYRAKDVYCKKVDTLETILKEINPDLQVVKHDAITTEDRISGYIFLCIDNIDTRRELCTAWKKNPAIKFVTDGRMGLTDGTVHSANWYDYQERENLIRSMQFSHEEALEQTPRSACGLTLSVVCTPRALTSLMVGNWIRYVNEGAYNRLIILDAYKTFLDSYPTS